MTDPIPKWQRLTGWVLSGFLPLVFAPRASFKITQPEGFLEEWSTYPAAALPRGVVELATFVLYFVSKTRYLGGAVATRAHANDGKFFVPVAIGVVT